MVFAGDLAKGAAATAAGWAAGGRPLAMACGLAAVLGHSFPVTRRLRGGRGVATAAGLAAVLYPVQTAVLVALWLAVARVSHTASLASLAIAVLLPLAVAAGRRPGWEVAAVAGLSVLVVARHAANLRRLARGEERSLHRELG
jgi:acyl phosphate:glycerol-3-phosphate acyltransferase